MIAVTRTWAPRLFRAVPVVPLWTFWRHGRGKGDEEASTASRELLQKEEGSRAAAPTSNTDLGMSFCLSNLDKSLLDSLMQEDQRGHAGAMLSRRAGQKYSVVQAVVRPQLPQPSGARPGSSTGLGKQ